MESKDGKDCLTFSLDNLSGSPASQARNWTPASAIPWTWSHPRPRIQLIRRKKTPSQLKRDQKRRTDFFAKKSGSVEIKVENSDEAEKATNVDSVDEITEMDVAHQEEVSENELVRTVGEYKDPKFRPWSVIEPEKECKALWERIETANKAIGIKEVGEGSTCFEHCYEFWGKWKVEKPGGTTLDVLKNLENWPKGTKILEVKPD